MTSLPQQSLAAVATAPNVMELRRLAIPDIGEGEAIVRIEGHWHLRYRLRVVPRRPGHSLPHHPRTRTVGPYRSHRLAGGGALGRECGRPGSGAFGIPLWVLRRVPGRRLGTLPRRRRVRTDRTG